MNSREMNEYLRRYWFVGLVIISLIVSLIINGYLSHPGVHVFGVCVLLDVLYGVRVRKWTGFGLLLIVALNLIGLFIILFGTDPVELRYSGFIGILCVLVTLFPMYKPEWR